MAGGHVTRVQLPAARQAKRRRDAAATERERRSTKAIGRGARQC